MLRRSLAAVVVTLVVGSIVLAGSYTGIVTKVDDKEVVIKVKKDKKDKEGEEKKFKVNKDTKYFTQKGKDEAKDSSLGDVTKAVETAVEKSKQKGAFAKIETEGEGDKEVITKITIFSGGKKKNDK